MTIDRIVACGGIAEKSALLMQIYADVCGRPIGVARSGQACALGAAVFASVVGGAHATVADAQRAMTGVKPRRYDPTPENARVYRRLFGLYGALHDAFGLAGTTATSPGS